MSGIAQGLMLSLTQPFSNNPSMIGNYSITTPHFTIMVLFIGQSATMCPKPRHLKHFLVEVLVGDLEVEVEGRSLETLVCEVVYFEKLERKVLV